ncbi:hypothetical protein LWI29_027280 [Acer saccharum]|uniref:NB-ARC domain-containing protein n=1 Tax=Acer saccharum TaxID=4024 RepID=A0AA39T6Y2_ACESA|nr:hypothetical protein LWI29_027280 [Acer saccharum]
MEEHKQEILQLLRDESNSLVILAGMEMGTASWMARLIIECATSTSIDGFCSESLWMSLTKNYDMKSLYKAIYDQLSSGSIPEEWEYEDNNSQLDKIAQGLKVNTVNWEQEEENQNAKQETKEETTDNLKLKIQAQLDKRKPVLLVLDCEGNVMDDIEFKQNVLPVLSSINHRHLKIIINRCVTEGGDAIQEQIELEPLSPDDSLSLLKERVGEQRVSKIPDFNIQFSDAIKEKTRMHCPAAITVVAGSFNDISGYDTLKSALQKAVYYEKPCQDGVNPLLYYAYDMMQSDVTKKCFWHSLQFVRNYGGVHYNQLITHWIMEGYFDPFDHIEKAYQAGHLVLMELMDRAMLKMQDNNIVVVEGAALDMIDTRPCGFGGTASLGLVRVYKNGESFGRVTHIDGMIKTLCNPKIVTDVSTLLIDGSRLNREVHKEFFSSMSRLKFLGVFNSGYKPLISSFSGLKDLDVLVLRNCDLLEDTTDISNLKTLRVLEVSDSRAGDSSLMSMPENLFDEMTQLQSLNLSGLQIESLPSLSKLIQLRLLILRRCSRLKKLQSLIGLANLEILDLSGAESFENFHDTGFSKIPKIQLINLSYTKIRKLPVFGELKDLTRILLRGCQDNLRQLPKLQQLTSLLILDLSGTSQFRSFMFRDSIAELNHLKVLNLSKTKISKLPPIPCNLSELNLSGCSELVELPSITSLTNLELLDVSDAPKLAKINHESFQHLTYLRYLNFSNTKVENLPTLSNLRNLRQLLLKNCTLLRNLPAMEGVTRLEELDLSGCSALQVNESVIESFRINMPYLKLNLDQCGSNLAITNSSNQSPSSLGSVVSSSHVHVNEILDSCSVKSEASGPTELNNLEVVQQAHRYFEIFKGLIVDLIFNFHERDESWEFFGKLRQEDALSLFAVPFQGEEEQFLPFRCQDYIRLVQGRNRPGYRVAFFMLIFSDWTFAALRISSNDSKLLRKIKSSVASVLSWFLIFKKPRWYQSQNQEVLATPFLFRRWCGYVSGHNLVRYCLKGRPTRIHKVHNRFQCAVQETIQYLKIDKFIKTLGFAIAKISQFFCINEVICFLGFIREIH